MTETAPTTVQPLRRLLRTLSHHRGRVWTASTCSVLNKVFDLAPPLLIGAAVDIVVKREGSLIADLGFPDLNHQLAILAALTLLIWGLESVFEYAFGVLWRNLAQVAQHELRLQAYGHIQDLEMAWFAERSRGGLMAILNDDVNQLERFLDHGANDLLQVSTTVVVVGVIFFYLSPLVAVLAFVPVPLILLGSFKFQARIAPRYALVRERVARLNAILANDLLGIATIKSFTSEAREVERVRQASDAYQQANREAIRLSSAFSPLIRMVIVVGFLATLVVGGNLTLEGQLAVGSYSVLIFLTQRLLWPLTRLGTTFDLYQRAMASTTRVLDLLDTPVTIVDGERALDRADVRGAVRFRDVTFAYPDREPALKGIDLEIPAGTTTAVVGATGAGKSTLVSLLLRFHDPQQGAVELDGVDVRQLRLSDLRQAIALVSQGTFLFPGTVAENVGYGREGGSRAQVEEACRLAEAQSFVEALPQGYETQIGEQGQKLSGGQRQRLSFARAVLKDAPLLVLDEATSAVDNETEAAMQRSLARISRDRTTIVIAHRLSTIRHADQICVLDQGLLVERGTHDQLLERDGIYARLWRVQTGEALEVGA